MSRERMEEGCLVNKLKRSEARGTVNKIKISDARGTKPRGRPRKYDVDG